MGWADPSDVLDNQAQCGVGWADPSGVLDNQAQCGVGWADPSGVLDNQAQCGVGWAVDVQPRYGGNRTVMLKTGSVGKMFRGVNDWLSPQVAIYWM